MSELGHAANLKPQLREERQSKALSSCPVHIATKYSNPKLASTGISGPTGNEMKAVDIDFESTNLKA